MHVRSRRAIVENRPGNVQFALVSGPPDEGRAVLLLHLMQALRYRGENTQLHQVTNGSGIAQMFDRADGSEAQIRARAGFMITLLSFPSG
jgi:hypothetical protein